MTAAESRRRDWEGRWRDYYADDDFEGCCGGAPRGSHSDRCVMFPPPRPRRGLVLEGDRVDSEQESVGMFDRPFLPNGDLPGENHRELPLEGPDWDAGLATRRIG